MIAMKLIHNTSVGPIIVCEACLDGAIQTALDHRAPLSFEDVTDKVLRGQPCDLCGDTSETHDEFEVMTGGHGMILLGDVPFAEIIDFKILFKDEGTF